MIAYFIAYEDSHSTFLATCFYVFGKIITNKEHRFPTNPRMSSRLRSSPTILKIK